jgi:hypothetical protein
MTKISRPQLLPLARLQWNLIRGLFWLLATVAIFPLNGRAETRVPGADRATLQVPEPKVSWQVGGSAFYTTGKYGTDVRTDTVYVPLTLRRYFDNADLTLVIPYVTVTSNCGVTVVNGVPLRTGGLCPTTPSASGTIPSRVTQSGIGDVLLIGRYYLHIEQEPGLIPSILLSGRVKAPTADRDRGLGTGEWDEGVGLGLIKLLTNRLIGFADAGYTLIGDPPGVNLRNQWSYDVGLGYYFVPTVLGSVYYEEARALLPTFNNPRDVYVAATWIAANDVWLNAGLLKGLSNGAPEYGGNVGLVFRF